MAVLVPAPRKSYDARSGPANAFAGIDDLGRFDGRCSGSRCEEQTAPSKDIETQRRRERKALRNLAEENPAMEKMTWQKVEAEKLSEKITRQMLNGDHTTVARIFLARGAIVPRHSHVSEQFSLILSGALKFVFDDGEMVVRSGEMVFIPSRKPHAAEALEDTVDLDIFSPRREDWIRRDDAYLRG